MRRSRSYSRKNQLDDTTVIVGGLVAVVVVGGLIYWATRPATATAAAAPANAMTGGATSAQLGVPGWMTQSQGAAYLNGQIDANGNPIGAPALPVAAGG